MVAIPAPLPAGQISKKAPTASYKDVAEETEVQHECEATATEHAAASEKVAAEEPRRPWKKSKWRW
jgi:hypothetical protein